MKFSFWRDEGPFVLEWCSMGDGSQLPSTRREQRKAARRKEAAGAR